MQTCSQNSILKFADIEHAMKTPARNAAHYKEISENKRKQ